MSARRASLLVVAVATAGLGFVGLGVWQLQRLHWKQDLIARVERRVNAAPAPVPPQAEWPALGKPDEYRRLRLRGRFEEREVLVQATTALGAGHWVLAPLRLQDGGVVLVNRGFVPPERRARGAHEPASGPTELVGLLRLTEPGGAFLRRNQPEQDRWTSRDVAAMAQRLGLAGPVAPFFVDEVADEARPQRWPRPGLTVLSFTNHHAIYAVTWFVLAGMCLAAVGKLIADGRRPS